MNNYIPFLKLKVNEVGALKELAADLKAKTVPFFDLAKKDGMTELSFCEMVEKSAKSLERNLEGFSSFFLDNFDIDDSIHVNGQNNYSFVIKTFSGQNFIPVVGLDRAIGRNELVFEGRKDGLIKRDAIAIRLQPDDFQSFSLIKDDILEITQAGQGLFSRWILVLDNRVCLNAEAQHRGQQIASFVHDSLKFFKFSAVVVAGSSIPSSIRDVLEVESVITHERRELAIYRETLKSANGFPLYLGDYTLVSPLYSDINIPPEAMQNVTAPKVIYPHGDVHYISRGGALKTHNRGSRQYNDIAATLVSLPFFRGAPYSFGDRYLVEKANSLGKLVTPSSILKPTINAHITYMLRNYHC